MLLTDMVQYKNEIYNSTEGSYYNAEYGIRIVQLQRQEPNDSHGNRL